MKGVEERKVELIAGAVLLELVVIGLLESQESISASEQDHDRCGPPAGLERADDESPSPSKLIAGRTKPLRLALPRLHCHPGRKLVARSLQPEELIERPGVCRSIYQINVTAQQVTEAPLLPKDFLDLLAPLFSTFVVRPVLATVGNRSSPGLRHVERDVQRPCSRAKCGLHRSICAQSLEPQELGSSRDAAVVNRLKEAAHRFVGPSGP